MKVIRDEFSGSFGLILVSFGLVSFRKVQFRFVWFRFVSQSTVSFRFVSFRKVQFRFVSFRFAKCSKPINITTKISISLDLAIASKNNTTALQRFPQFLKAGTVYKLKWGLRVGVKICLKCMYDCIHLIHKWPPTWDERATKHGIEAF